MAVRPAQVALITGALGLLYGAIQALLDGKLNVTLIMLTAAIVLGLLAGYSIGKRT